MKLCIEAKQFQNKVLDFFVIVILMIMDLCIKQAISKQTSKILVKLMIWGVIHHNKAISEQSSEFLCNTVVLW